MLLISILLMRAFALACWKGLDTIARHCAGFRRRSDWMPSGRFTLRLLGTEDALRVQAEGLFVLSLVGASGGPNRRSAPSWRSEASLAGSGQSRRGRPRVVGYWCVATH
jgi:hypothetical protein